MPNVKSSFTETWRDYTITNLCACFGPLIACGLCEVRFLGRRYTMSIGAILTAIFFFGYTAIRTPAQNLALSCVICKCRSSHRSLESRASLLTPGSPSRLHQHLLWHALRIHGRGAPLGPSDDRQRDLRGLQSHHGIAVGSYCTGRRHDHDHASVHLCCRVHHHVYRVGGPAV